jgi:hypothetical protein
MVNRRSTSPTPEPILRLQRYLEDFRSSQSRRTKLPESLWQAAVEVARQYGLYPGAHPCTAGIHGLEEASARLGLIDAKDSRFEIVQPERESS